MATNIAILRDTVETLAYVAQIVAAAVLVYAAYSYLLQRQQLHFDVITNCTQRFQEILPGLYSDDDLRREESKKQYVDLCNEELFYFTNGYLPPDIIEEWIDGMVLYLPHSSDDKWFPLPEDHNESHRVGPELLKGYSRIREVFNVGDHYDTKDSERRTELVRRIRSNIDTKRKKRRS